MQTLGVQRVAGTQVTRKNGKSNWVSDSDIDIEGKTILGYPIKMVSTEEYQRGIDARRRFIISEAYSLTWECMVPTAEEMTGLTCTAIEEKVRFVVTGSFTTGEAVKRLTESGELPKRGDPHPSIAGMVALEPITESHGGGPQVVVGYEEARLKSG